MPYVVAAGAGAIQVLAGLSDLDQHQIFAWPIRIGNRISGRENLVVLGNRYSELFGERIGGGEIGRAPSEDLDAERREILQRRGSIVIGVG
jgi:hypothetical protein